jgi:hypothetical protein
MGYESQVGLFKKFALQYQAINMFHPHDYEELTATLRQTESGGSHDSLHLSRASLNALNEASTTPLNILSTNQPSPAINSHIKGKEQAAEPGFKKSWFAMVTGIALG